MGAAGCCGFGLPPIDGEYARSSARRQNERDRLRAANLAAIAHITQFVPWVEARNQARDELTVPEREHHQVQLAGIAGQRAAILAQPASEQNKVILALCDQHETSHHAALAFLDLQQQRRGHAHDQLREALAKHPEQPTTSLVSDLMLPCISWCVDAIVDSTLHRSRPALVHRAQAWVREADPMLDEVLQGGPLLQCQRVVETCLRIGCYHLVDRLLRRFGGTCDYVARPSRGAETLSERSWLWVMAKCSFVHVADFTPIFALISAHGLDPTLIPTEPNPESALQMARGMEQQIRAEEAAAAAVAAAAAGSSMPDPEAVSPLLAALAPDVAASSVPASAPSSSSLAEVFASSSSDAASSAPRFENCLLRYTTYTSLAVAAEEEARCLQMRRQFLLALLRAWRTHSSSVHVLLLEAAPSKLIPDLVAIVADYLDLCLNHVKPQIC